MRILFFGDVNGSIGIAGLTSLLPSLIESFQADFVIANGENAAKNGDGILEKEYLRLIKAGVDAVTLGNHWRGKNQIAEYIDSCDRLIRPLNLLNFSRGVGTAVFDVGEISIRVTNLLGTAFMKEAVVSPYQALNDLLAEEEKTSIHIIDYHAESTSEKKTFAAYFDGKISAVIGTHTHVQTNDAYIFPKGTGYLSDAGLCGAYDSIIGTSFESVFRKIIQGERVSFTIPKEGRKVVCFVFLEIDAGTGHCLRLKPYTYIDGEAFDGEASH